nr:hypothetical protein [Odoribacter sp. OF09-27XD]
MSEIQVKGDDGVRKKGKQKKIQYPGRFYPHGGYEYVADNFFYALYFSYKTPNHGDQYAA